MKAKRHSVKPQDKPQTKLRIATRRTKLMKIFAGGATVSKAQKELAKDGIVVSRATVGFDLQALGKDAPVKLEKARAEAEVELKALRKFVADADDMDSSATVNSLLAIHDRIARLLGLEAPTKSIQANLNADNSPVYTDFLRCSHGLSEAQMAQVFEHMAALPRAKIIVDESYLPPAEEEQ